MNELAQQILRNQLEESIFSSNPAKQRAAAGHLRRLMREPLRAKDAHEKVKKHADDPKMIQHLHHLSTHAPEADVRPILKKRMKELNVQGF